MLQRRAHARARLQRRPALGAAALNSSIEGIARLSREDFDALVARRVAEREQQMAWRTATLRAQVSDARARVRAWPAGTTCPLGRLREAWAVHRYGLAEVVEAGAAAAGAARPELTRRVGEAIGLYEAYAEQRPPGWPESGAAALCGSPRSGARTGSPAMSRPDGLARGMRALAAEHDPARLDARARERAPARSRRRRGGSCSGSLPRRAAP